MNKSKRILSAVLAGIVFVGGIIAGSVTGFFGKLFKGADSEQAKKGVKSKDSVTTIDNEKIKSLKGNIYELGISINIPTEKEEKLAKYGAVETYVQGVDIKPEDVVEVVDPKTGETITYVNKEAASKSDKVGTVTYDTTATQTVLEDGTVIENETGYEIVDPKTGETITGNSEVPEGYFELAPGIFLPEKYKGKVVYIDTTWYGYDENGVYGVVANIGDILDKESFEAVKNYWSTVYNPPVESYEPVQPVTTDSTPETQETFETTYSDASKDVGITNPNGTFTIYGNTYINEETYKRIYNGEDDIYIDDDGVIWIKSDYEKHIGISSSQGAHQKVLTIGQRRIIR